MTKKINTNSLLKILVCLIIVLSGCSSISQNDGPSTPSVQTDYESKITTGTDSRDPSDNLPERSANGNNSTNLNKTEKISVFANTYQEYINNSQGVNIITYSISDDNNSVTIRYFINNSWPVAEDIRLALSYVAHANDYSGDTFASVTDSFIPQRINYVGVLKSKQEVYSYRYINKSMVDNYRQNKWNKTQYVLSFYDTVTYGPAANSSVERIE
ncbi:hypothetical protein [Haloarcula onubensis]|uniref:Lipoprotein n=1 Tax=Haloarcula onubensis TaxID=2950539 RepID=A0ABU2FJE4_9EURY|nr:hypothetical protein [Halomicroarcula sp. S3CR25-11]MDS0280868.1 hypothetical protein [Halomicroarcula sp. S3CR25-11]